MALDTGNLLRSAAGEPFGAGTGTLYAVHSADEFGGVTPPSPAIVTPARITLTGVVAASRVSLIGTSIAQRVSVRRDGQRISVMLE